MKTAFENIRFLTTCEYKQKKSLCAFVGLMFAGFFCADLSICHDWMGWRGLEKEGRHRCEKPLIEWSEQENVVWKNRVPGEGHSSPIINDNTIMLTNCLKTTNSRIWYFGFKWLQLLILIILTLGVLHIYAKRCLNRNFKQDHQEFFLVLLGGAIFVLILVFYFFGEQLFDYERCRIRSWIASSVFLTICCSFMLLIPEIQKTLKKMLSVFMIVFGLIVLFFVPVRSHAYRFGLIGTSSMVMYLISSFPVFIGGSYLLSLSKRKKDEKNCFEKYFRIFKYLGIIVLFFFIFLFIFKLTGENKSITAVLNTSSYQPKISFSYTIVLLGFYLLIFKIKNRIKTDIFNILFSLSGVFLLFFIIINIIEYGAKYFSYLSYHLGNPQLVPVLGWEFVIGFGCFLIASFILICFCRKTIINSFQKITFFSIFILGILYFSSANFFTLQLLYARSIICYNKKDGALMWICKDLISSKGQMHIENSPATPTPVTDGTRIYAYFGGAGIMCTNFNGDLIWKNESILFDNIYGASASPVITEKLLLVITQWQTQNYLIALNKVDGRIMWKKKCPEAKSGIHRPPLMKKLNGHELIIVWGTRELIALHSIDGTIAWRQNLDLEQIDHVASIISKDHYLYLAGLDNVIKINIKKIESGSDPVIWRTPLRGPSVPSPVLANGMIFIVSDHGRIYCMDEKNGKILWKKRLKGHFYPSVTAINDLIYITSNNGKTFVIEASQDYKLLSANDINEKTYASLTPHGSSIFIRTIENLYCLGSMKHYP